MMLVILIFSIPGQKDDDRLGCLPALRHILEADSLAHIPVGASAFFSVSTSA
ncbi:MAG: hypothetical protein KME16_04950 [Scytolyngbya sp. HA4215-MV1]|nr:hypothetical protein [Scytolyngbya sp. HA4215-MV1]